jgi:phenylalanyl-tRNA synthetase alpha chain
MKQKLDKLKAEALASLKEAANSREITEIKQKYLGRKGPVALLMKELGSLAPELRRAAGEAINAVKQTLQTEVDARHGDFERSEEDAVLASEAVDVTLPGRRLPLGSLHPVTTVMSEIEDFFGSLGFEVAEGPEIETDYYNFEALNIPKDHPARDMQDTFYVNQDAVLRTHTSPVQIRVMQGRKPPLRVIAPGAVYRRDSDITHTPMFHQVEGFMVDKNITMGHLKGVLSSFLKHLFGKKREVRFRPSFFPFTEPSAEVDIQCVLCDGKGCRVCKDTGWLEILGCGMIHPNVFKSVDYDSSEVTGFAFGLGIERIAMLKYGIDDLRLFYENDIRFLRQF